MEARPRVEAGKGEGVAARPPQPVIDFVTEVVPASGHGEDQTRAPAGEIFQDREGVLGVGADGMLGVGEVGLQLLPIWTALEGAASYVAPRVLRAHDERGVPSEDAPPIASPEPSASRQGVV